VPYSYFWGGKAPFFQFDTYLHQLSRKYNPGCARISTIVINKENQDSQEYQVMISEGDYKMLEMHEPTTWMNLRTRMECEGFIGNEH